MTVLSIDGKSWLTKLDRLGKRAASDKSTVFNNLGHLINFEMLKELLQQLNGSKAVGVDRVSKAKYMEKL